MSVQKGVRNTRIYSASPKHTANCAINELRDMTELKVNTSTYDNFWCLEYALSVRNQIT